MGIQESTWEGEVGAGKARLGDDWEKFNAISRGDVDWIEYTKAIFASCISCSPWFAHLESDLQVSCIRLTPLGTLIEDFCIPLQCLLLIYCSAAPTSCEWIKW